MVNYSTFLSTNGENKIVTYQWLPTGKPKGIVQIVHGMKEYIGRYQDFANFLTANGYIVAGHDHIGHGLTALEYGMFGYFGENYGAKALVDDSRKHTRILLGQYPNLPLFLLGHSMGSFVTRLQVLKDSDLIAGYICMGSSDTNPLAPYLRGLSGASAKVVGKKKVSVFIGDLMQKMVFDKTRKKGEPQDSWISHDSETVEKYANDPLTQFYFTNEGYSDLMDLTMASTEDEWYYNLDPLLPILITGGSEDPVSVMGCGLKSVYKKLNKITYSVYAELIIYDNMRHEILNEIDKEIVYSDILDWITMYNYYLEESTDDR